MKQRPSSSTNTAPRSNSVGGTPSPPRQRLPRTKGTVLATVGVVALVLLLYLCLVVVLSSTQQFTTEHGTASIPVVTQATAEANNPSESHVPAAKLDFFVAGFPKSGTTSLLYSLAAHPEIAMDRLEHCAVSMDTYGEAEILARFRHDVESLPINNSKNNKKRGIKCPDALYQDNALQRLAAWQPDTQWVIGVRHPVWQLESYYNYRVTEMYDKKWWIFRRIRSLLDIMDGTVPPWKGISPTAARYELFLQQLDKVPLTAAQANELQQHAELSVQPNRFSVFVYALEQIQDHDVERGVRFRQDLQHFLGLQQPLQAVGHENRNHFVGAAAHPETVQICHVKFAAMRRQLVAEAAATADWILHEFLQADGADVTVSNRKHFTSILQEWKTDPCTATPRST